MTPDPFFARMRSSAKLIFIMIEFLCCSALVAYGIGQAFKVDLGVSSEGALAAAQIGGGSGLTYFLFCKWMNFMDFIKR